MIVYAVLGVALLAACVAAGLAVWGFTWWRDRRRMTAAFARGRAEGVVRLPATVEPMPVVGRNRLEVA